MALEFLQQKLILRLYSTLQCFCIGQNAEYDAQHVNIFPRAPDGDAISLKRENEVIGVVEQTFPQWHAPFDTVG